MKPLTVGELAKSMETYSTIIEYIEYLLQMQKQCVGADMLGLHHELGVMIEDLSNLLEWERVDP